MRAAWIAAAFAPLLLAGVVASRAAPAASPPPDPQSGQGRAWDVGRTLIGRPGPAVVLTTVDGQRIDLARLYGKKPIYLKFWATWCVPCRLQMPAFEKDYETLGDKVQVVGVNTGFDDSLDGVKAYRQKLAIHMPLAIDDGSLAGALNLRVTPQHVVIGRDGRILYVGHEEDERLHQALDQAVAEPAGPAVGVKLAREATYRVGDAPKRLAGGPADPLAAFTGPSADARPRVLVFFSPSCEGYLADKQPDRSKACKRVRLAVEEAQAHHEIRALDVASGLWVNDKDLKDYLQRNGATVPAVLDASGRLFRAFEVREEPTVVLIDGKGRIARRLGPQDADLAAAIQAVKGAS